MYSFNSEKFLFLHVCLREYRCQLHVLQFYLSTIRTLNTVDLYALQRKCSLNSPYVLSILAYPATSSIAIINAQQSTNEF